MYCRSKNYNFQLVLNGLLFSFEPTSETYLNNKEDPMVGTILDFNTGDIKKLKDNVTFGRVVINLIEEKKYMMSFAWSNPNELSLLEAFPEVITVDTTIKINDEKRPSLTIGRKYSNGHIFIFSHLGMPNKQS